MFLLGILVLFAVVILLAILRASLLVWTLTVVLMALLFAAVLSVFWVVLLLLWLPLLMPSVRCRLFSARVFRLLKSKLPPMRQTEKEAIDAGDIWWDAELFSGKPDWKQWDALPMPSLSADEQTFLDNETETLCRMLDDWKIINEDYDLPAAVWQYLKEKRFFGMVIEKAYGGLAFSATAHSAIISKIATRSPSAAVTAMVPNSLGPAELLMRYGTEQQKSYYLPRLAQGDEIPCFALTGPMAGSDAASLPDYGVVCEGEYAGKQVLGIKLSWEKRYITLAPVATLLGLAFHLYDPEQHLGEQDDIGITLALIPTNHAGVEIGQRHYPAFMAFMNGPTTGKDVFIPLDFVIGGQAMLGKGWRMLMECLSTGRSISLPAMASATAKLAYRMTGAYARIRKQFNVPIAQFEGVELVLGRIAGLSYLLEATRAITAKAVDLGLSPAIISAITKYHTTEISRKIINDAMDVHGGKGIQMGPRNYLAGAYLGIPVSITVEGANILTRNLIIFGQGIMRCHPVLLTEIDAMGCEDPEAGLKQFDKALVKHLGFLVSNLVRSVFFGVTGCHLMRTHHRGKMAKYAKQISRFSSALALVSDIALLSLGGALKRKENLSARLGDVLSYLYMASCALKTFKDHGEMPEEQAYADWALQHCLYEVQTAFSEFFDNFPIKWLAKILRLTVMPYGKRFKKPSDQLNQALIAEMTQPSVLRDRLTQYCYLPTSEDAAVGCVENAFTKAIAVSEIDKKFKQALKANHIKRYQPFAAQVSQAIEKNVLTTDEGALFITAQAAIADVIAVDTFDKSYFERKS